MTRTPLRRSTKPIKRSKIAKLRRAGVSIRWSSLKPIGKKRSKVMADGRERLSPADYANRRREVWERDGRRCQNVTEFNDGSAIRCQKVLTFDECEIDHIVKRSHGRDDRMENLRTLCKDCHRARHEAERRPKR